MSAFILPLAEIKPDPRIAALPKADLHIHQEWSPRLDRVLARREGRAPYNWRHLAERLMTETSPGMPRLRHLATVFPVGRESDAEPENFIARVEDVLDEAAADGAILVEIRFGNEAVLRPNFMSLFREAERRVQARYPQIRAEAVFTFLLGRFDCEQLERLLKACIQAAEQGLGGIDFLYEPYDTEADWAIAYKIAEQAAAAGLGITAHAGEFSTANIAAALRVPGLTRIGHATQVVHDPRAFALLGESGVTVECSLSCNVVLGAVPSYTEHPIRQLTQSGIPITICTDDPVQICTTIGREYTVAHTLGFSSADLLAVTRNAIKVAFTTEERRSELLAELDEWVQAGGTNSPR
jgi:adenosine deaminase